MGACARNMQSDSAEIKPAQCCIKLVFHLTYTMMHGSTKFKKKKSQFVYFRKNDLASHSFESFCFQKVLQHGNVAFYQDCDYMTSVFCVLLNSCLDTHADIGSSSHSKFNIPNPSLCRKELKTKKEVLLHFGGVDCLLLTKSGKYYLESSLT